MYELVEASLASLNHFFFPTFVTYIVIAVVMTSEFCYLSVSHSGYAQVSATMYNLSLLPLNVITWLCSCIIFNFGIIVGIGMEFL